MTQPIRPLLDISAATSLPWWPDFALSSYEFDFLWGALGLGRKPYPLQVPPTSRVPERRVELAAEVYRELADRGLVSADVIDAGLESLLRLVGDHRVSVNAVAHIGYQVRALAAADEANGVLAVLAGGELWLTGIRPAELASAIVGVLPAAEPGSGVPISLPVPAAGDVSDVFGDLVLEPEVLAASEAAALTELGALRRGGGRFGCSTVGREPTSAVVGWFDTPHGRYLIGREGPRLSVRPAGSVLIEQCLTEALAAVGLDHLGDLGTRPPS